MMQLTLSFRSLLALASVPLLLALLGGCAGGPQSGGVGSPRGGGMRTMDEDRPREQPPKPTFLVNDGIGTKINADGSETTEGVSTAGAGLVVTIKDPEALNKQDGQPVTGCYVVAPANRDPNNGKPVEDSNPGPRPIIAVNLISHPKGSGSVDSPVRPVIIVYGDKVAPPIVPGAVIVRVIRPIYYSNGGPVRYRVAVPCDQSLLNKKLQHKHGHSDGMPRTKKSQEIRVQGGNPGPRPGG